MADDSLIELYLVQLRRHLGRGGHVDALTREVADHLHEAVAALTLVGVDPVAAQRLAVERFGRPEAVARSLMREQRGAPSSLTQFAGGVAVVGGLACVLAFAPMTYVALMGGPRPRSEMIVTLLMGIVQVALLALVVAVTARSTVGPRKTMLLAAIVPVGALSVYSIGLRGAADLVDSNWAAPALVLISVLAQLVLLRPWSMTGGFGPALTRQALSVAALLELAYWLALSVSNTAADTGSWFALATMARWVSLPFLALGMIAIGRQLWTERRSSQPATA